MREWHELLLDAVFTREGGDRILRRIVKHHELAGPDIRFIEARMAHMEGRQEQARTILAECLREFPRDPGFLELAGRLRRPGRGMGAGRGE